MFFFRPPSYLWICGWMDGWMDGCAIRKCAAECLAAAAHPVSVLIPP